MPKLQLSYDHLSFELRQCFAYCSLYPKDWTYNKDELIEQWMAQGYLGCQDDEECLQDVGERYVHIFIMRSFFQDVEMNKFGEIESFKMHDLIHDLSQSIASSDRCLFYERNFFESPVHINFAYCSKLSLDSLDVSRLRTILRLHCFSKSHLSNLLKFKRLRSLDFSEIDMTDLPDSIGKMIHLRYLDLSYCGKLTRLPKSLSKLVNLQTLKLTGCISLREPSSVDVITKLINLRHLHIEACPAFICAMPIGLDRLTNLQRLIYFVVGDQSYTKGKHAKLNELEELNLRHQLIIDNLDLVMDVEESRVAHLKAKKNLKSLTLRYSRSDINCDSVQVLENLCPHPNLKRLKITNYPGVKLSSWLPSLTNLVELNLYGFKNCQYLPPLEGLVSLKTLEIMDMDALEYIYYEGCSSSTNFFPSLEKLRIYECQSLRGWQREADTNNRKDNEKQLLLPSFPRLSYLEISGCLNLTCMPTFPSLVKFLCLEDCSMKPLIETLKVSATEELHPPLSILEHLKIYCKDIDFLPEEWMQNLTTLKRLDIGRPSSLVTVFCHMRHLPTTLEELFIGGIDNHNPWSSGDEDFSSQFQVLCCLHSLGHFEISDCDQNVKTLPEWICHLQTIRSIAIRFCPNLESWPEGMHRLTNLHTLYISSSPLLEERCERGRGAEWPKIAHVPNIWVGDCKI